MSWSSASILSTRSLSVSASSLYDWTSLTSLVGGGALSSAAAGEGHAGVPVHDASLDGELSGGHSVLESWESGGRWETESNAAEGRRILSSFHHLLARLELVHRTSELHVGVLSS